MVVLDKFIDWDDAMLVPLDFFIDMESLELRQNLDNCLLHASLHHQGTVVGGGKTLLSNLYAVDWSHSVTDLVILLCHELTSLSVLVVRVFKNKYFSLLPKVDFVENLDAGVSGVQVIMEVAHVLVG